MVQLSTYGRVIMNFEVDFYCVVCTELPIINTAFYIIIFIMISSPASLTKYMIRYGIWNIPTKFMYQSRAALSKVQMIIPKVCFVKECLMEFRALRAIKRYSGLIIRIFDQ